ncbi:hypothetical protein L5515_007982 [Caenorhabditis briggsae]|uniref:Glycosyltransferase family 92 protein n=1 Tax=Caenorhabditis briggsae TaxID=6238 RepID=A0AAE9JLN8_CAEBR|nr:hypothetical protein L5515_007982 [Caenorhabditis briggsae]
MFGKEPKWLHLVEMIEHYKLQGVSKFYFYVREIGLYDTFLLKYYADKKEEVELIEIPPIYFDAVSQQLLAIADCHLRNRLFSNWTNFSDIDERMMMTEEKETLREFLQDSISDKNGAVMFAQRWIFKYEKLPQKFENYQQYMMLESMRTDIYSVDSLTRCWIHKALP